MSAATPKPFERVLVLGGGAWGTALALVAARAGRDVTLWARDPATVNAILQSAANPDHLPGITFDANLTATTDLGAVAAAQCIIAAVPAQALRGVLAQTAGAIPAGVPIVSAAKGLERGSHATMSRVIAETVPEAVPAMLSGPSFADDVARRLPTALTIAATEAALAERLALTLASSSFRPYASTDLIGVELGGALKNVIAIAAGIVVGRKLGASAQAALIARGFAELSRLARKLGARSETLMGLSGLGDLVLTTSSLQSRNFALGVAIGGGGPVAALIGTGAKLAEGAYTARVAVELARDLGVELPIAEAVSLVLSGDMTVASAVEALMSRPLRNEAE